MLFYVHVGLVVLYTNRCLRHLLAQNAYTGNMLFRDNFEKEATSG